MKKPKPRAWRDLSPEEQRLAKSRYADVCNNSPAMNDEHLTPETKALIKAQAAARLREEGWIEDSKSKDNLLTKLFNILLG
jgi:hypothetical protein